MEAMVSRWTERTPDRPKPFEYAIYTEMVAVWTADGNFTIPYTLFVALFGIELGRFDERKTVTLPSPVQIS